MSRIALEELFRRAVDVVQTQKVPFVVYGGVAFPFWGRVVPTDDVDLVIRVTEATAANLLRALRGAGFEVPRDAETLLFIDTWVVASLGGRDVDFALGATDFDAEAIRRGVRVRVFEREVPIVTPEDLILYKLASHRRRDLGHVEDIIKRQGRKLDLRYLRGWAQKIAEATGKFEVPATLQKMLAEEGLG